jgi:hypothetical protein
LTDVSLLAYEHVRVVTFGSRASDCYTGPLIWQQGDVYVIINPVELSPDVSLVFDWWVGEPG